MKRWSSLRRTAAPIPVALMAAPPVVTLTSLLCSALSCSAHGLGAGRNHLDDVVVAGAAADVALELLADGVIVEVVTLAPDHVDRGHNHAGRAVAALQAMVLPKRLLHRMQRAIGGSEPLDG